MPGHPMLQELVGQLGDLTPARSRVRLVPDGYLHACRCIWFPKRRALV